MSKIPEDYPSDSDESDEDFRPEKEDAESGSEIDSDDNVEDDEDIQQTTSSSSKRKRKNGKTGQKKARTEVSKVERKSPKKSNDLEDDDEQLSDALWADFLAGTDSSSSSKATTKKDQQKTETNVSPKKPVETVKPQTITKVFEFAGERVEVSEKVSSTESAKPKPALSTITSNGNGAAGGPPKLPLGARSAAKGSGGLGSVLNQLGKKNKLSTLEKTKLDWKQFKSNEGIEEELETHNKGKDGYLERQDFLQRTDVRQFEIEKSFRLTKRSNR